MNINELDLKDEVIVTEDLGFDAIPEEMGPFLPPLYPGPYRFRIPNDLSEVWRKFETAEGERIAADFSGDSTLEVTQSKNGQATGSAFRVSVTNRQRARGIEKVPVSDMDYLLRALQHPTRPRTNREYIQALMKHAGEEFAAEVEWSAFCNPKKNAYYVDEADQQLKEAEGTPGCGQNFYQKDIPKDQFGQYLDRFPCKSCGAALRAWGNLVRFKAVTES